MEIKRNFTHSGTQTNFGDVTIEFPTEGFKLNGNTLSEASVRAIINQGLQILQDTYAGVGKSKSIDEARAAFDNKLAALIDGTVGQRGAGSGLNALERMVISIAREELRKLYQQAGKPYKEFTAKADDEQSEIIEKLVEKIGRDKLEKEAKRRLAEKAKTLEAIALDDLGL